MKKRICRLAALLLCFCAFALTGCRNDYSEEQDRYKLYGINCMQKGDYKDAVIAFENALKQSAGRVTKREIDICYYLAEAQYRNGEPEEAEATYNALLDYDDIAETYYLRGMFYSDQGRWEEAKKDYETAASLEQGDIALYVGIYEALAANGCEEEGKSYLDKALTIEGDSPEDNLHRGKAYFVVGDTQKAVEFYEKAIEQGKMEANFQLAELYVSQGDAANADVYFQAYLDSGSYTSSELYQMGQRQMKNGDYAHAVSYFQTILQMEKVSNKQIVMKECVIAYEKQSDYERARELLKEYVKLYPEDDDAQRELTFLESR